MAMKRSMEEMTGRLLSKAFITFILSILITLLLEYLYGHFNILQETFPMYYYVGTFTVPLEVSMYHAIWGAPVLFFSVTHSFFEGIYKKNECKKWFWGIVMFGALIGTVSCSMVLLNRFAVPVESLQSVVALGIALGLVIGVITGLLTEVLAGVSIGTAIALVHCFGVLFVADVTYEKIIYFFVSIPLLILLNVFFVSIFPIFLILLDKLYFSKLKLKSRGTPETER